MKDIELTRSQKAWVTFRDRWICEKTHLVGSVADFANEFVSEVCPFFAPHEVDRYILENSNNPYELAKLYLKAKRERYEDLSIEGIIADNIGSFPLSSFRRFGDANCLTDEITENYISDAGLSIDVQAQQITETYYREITPQDIVEFVFLYPKRNYKESFLKQVEKAFHACTSFNIKPYYAEYLVSVCENQEETINEIEHEDCPF
jgi:hypothetical protein